MKWLLITNTDNWNPGDEWIRIGVQRLVHEVDPSPEWIILNKQLDHESGEIEFDKAIWCGSPMFWSNEVNDCWTNYWWEPWINGWLFTEKRKVLVLGVGDVLGPNGPKDDEGYCAAIRAVQEKSWGLVTRNRVCDDDSIPVSCCPSVFALAGCKTVKDLLLCNLMPDGAHDAFLDPNEAEYWRKILPTISCTLQSLGFRAVCHSNGELETLKVLGWPDSRIYPKPETAGEYLPLYARTARYVGNRMHGAMVTRGAGGEALVFGYESRTEMVKLVGGQTRKPSEWHAHLIGEWLQQPEDPYDWRPEFERQVKLVRSFAEA